jgi:RNA polymerase sigma factor (sigma-70 family)
MSTLSPEQTETQRFRELMSQMRSGSYLAAWDLVEEYGPHILAVVRRMLDERLRTEFDSQDFAQAVWASVIRMQDRLQEIDEPKRFVKFLAAMAKNKVVDEMRRKTTRKNDMRLERPLNDSVFPDVMAAGPQGTPSQVVIAREKWERLRADLSEKERRVVELRLARKTYKEIAEELNMDERTARRIIKRLVRDHAV